MFKCKTLKSFNIFDFFDFHTIFLNNFGHCQNIQFYFFSSEA